MRRYQRMADGEWADALLMDLLADELVRRDFDDQAAVDPLRHRAWALWLSGRCIPTDLRSSAKRYKQRPHFIRRLGISN